MRFHRINIENFLVLSSASVDLADRGLVLVQGENQQDSSAASNGAGKSSIADAICWCIYGTTARDETGDAVVNRTAKKNTRVELLIDDDGIQYRIVRHRKHKTGKNNVHVFMNDGSLEKDITKGTDKLTQEVIDKIVGASHEVFKGSIYAGQEKMPDLPSMTDKSLKVLIEEAAGINALEAAYQKARENMGVAQNNFRTADAEVKLMESTLVVQRNQLATVKTSDADWQVENKRLIEEKTKLVRDDLLPAAKTLAEEAPQSEIDDVNTAIAAIDAKIAAISGERTEEARLASEAVSATVTATSAKSKLETTRRALNRARTEHSAAAHKVGCPCDSCGRPLTTTELNAVIDKAKLEFDKLVDQEVIDLAEYDAAEKARESAQEALSAFKRGMTDISSEAAQRAVLESRKAALMVKVTERARVVEQAKAELAAIEKMKVAVSPFATTITATETAITDTEAKLKKATDVVKIRQEQLDLETEVVRVFSPAGVRARILDEVTPYLNAQTAKYLSIMSDGNINAEWSTITMNKSGDLKEKFSIDVTSTISAETFKGLSGGEKRKVRVATALALQDLVATRASKPIDLFIGDEIDHALDAPGLERLMVILDEKASERGTVMVISHNSLKDEIRNVLTVTRSAKGETTIMESTS